MILFSAEIKADVIDMEYSLGFDGVFQLGKWTPVTIILENRGKMIQGTLEILVSSGNEYGQNIQHNDYRLDIELPTHSKKSYSFSVLIESYVHPLIISLQVADETVISVEVNLRNHYNEKGLAVVVGNRMGVEPFSLLRQEVTPVTTRLEVLPDEWIGYDGVAILIISSSDLAQLNDQKFEALRHWLMQGGLAILTNELNYGAFQQHRIQQIISAKVSGFHRLKALRSMEAFCGMPIKTAGPLMVLNATVKDARTIVDESGIPIIIARTIGDGRVMVLMFDHQQAAFKNWSGMQTMWKRLFDMGYDPIDQVEDLRRRLVRGFLDSDIQLQFPRFLYILLFLTVYFIITKIVFFRIQSKNSNMSRNITLLAVSIVVFSTAAFILIYKGHKRTNSTFSSFSHLKMVEEQELIQGRTVIGVHSLKSANYTLPFGNHPYAIRLVGHDEERSINYPRLVNHQQQQGRDVTISIRRWARRYFQIDFLREFKLKGWARIENGGLTVTLQNATAEEIVESGLFFNGKLLNFGHLGAGERQVRWFRPALLNAKKPFDTRMIESSKQAPPPPSATFLEQMRQRYRKDLLISLNARHNSSVDTVHLFGWIRTNGLPDKKTASGIFGESVSLLEMTIPVMKATNTK